MSALKPLKLSADILVACLTGPKKIKHNVWVIPLPVFWHIPSSNRHTLYLFFVCLLISVLHLDVQLSRGEIWNPIPLFNPVICLCLYPIPLFNPVIFLCLSKVRNSISIVICCGMVFLTQCMNDRLSVWVMKYVLVFFPCRV